MVWFRRRLDGRRGERLVHDRPPAWGSWSGAALLILGGLALWWLTSRDSRVADAWMGTVYPLTSRLLGALTGWLPFSLAELLAALALVWMSATLLRNLRRVRRRSRHVANVVLHAAGAATSLTAVVFVLWLSWGVGFHRTPLARRAGLDVSVPNAAELRMLAGALIDELNAARPALQEDDAGVARLAGNAGESLSRVPLGYLRAAQVHPGIASGYVARVKALRLTAPVLTSLGVDGAFVPVTGEPGVNAALPGPALAYAGCVQEARQLGWVREEEAMFVGYLGCTWHPDPGFRYSAELVALERTMARLADLDPQAHAELMARRGPGVIRDWDALQRFSDRRSGSLGPLAARPVAVLRSLPLERDPLERGDETFVGLLVAHRRRQAELSGAPDGSRR